MLGKALQRTGIAGVLADSIYDASASFDLPCSCCLWAGRLFIACGGGVGFSVVRKMDTSEQETFHYFGFGSNLLKERLNVLNPTAVFKTTGKLKGYKLAFRGWTSNTWHGAPATILKSPDNHVWGCVWIIHMKDLENLDKQEGVSRGRYKPLQVEIETAEGESLQCRTYQLIDNTSEDPRPSPQYLGVIIKGAKQNGLPKYYIDQLESVEHNGYTGECELFDSQLAHIVKS